MSMFNGKRERFLEEELEKAKQQKESQKAALSTVRDERGKFGEQITKTNDSHKKISGNMEQIQENVSQIADLAESSAEAVSDIHSTIIRMNNTVESFDANHSVFLGKLQEQNEQLMKVVEGTRGLTPVMEEINGLPEKLQENYDVMDDTVKDMQVFSKNMSVKALNAAIEAGRMGDAGSRFVAAAEDVHSFSQQYDQAAGLMAERLESYKKQTEELTAQVEKLQGVVREQTAALSKLAAAALQGMLDYKGGQLELHGIVQDAVVGKSDALLQSEHEVVNLKDKITLCIEDIREELKGQKEAILELDRSAKTIWQAVDSEK